MAMFHIYSRNLSHFRTFTEKLNRFLGNSGFQFWNVPAQVFIVQDFQVKKQYSDASKKRRLSSEVLPSLYKTSWLASFDLNILTTCSYVGACYVCKNVFYFILTFICLISCEIQFLKVSMSLLTPCDIQNGFLRNTTWIRIRNRIFG